MGNVYRQKLDSGEIEMLRMIHVGTYRIGDLRELERGAEEILMRLEERGLIEKESSEGYHQLRKYRLTNEGKIVTSQLF